MAQSAQSFPPDLRFSAKHPVVSEASDAGQIPVKRAKQQETHKQP